MPSFPCAGELTRRSKEKRAIFGIATPVEAQQREFVTGHIAVGAAALQQMFNRGGECFRNARYVATELSRPVGFPLSNRTSANVARVSQIFLRHALIAAQGSDSGPYGIC